MKKAAIAFLLFSLFSMGSIAQPFVRVDTVKVMDDVLPLKNAWAGGMNNPSFWPMDLDGDGIMDLVTYEPAFAPGHYKFMPFLNMGDSGTVNYRYAPEYSSRFPDIYAWLVVYDYNCDGLNDLFCLSIDCSCGIMVYRNDYTVSGGLAFTKVLNKNGNDYLLFGNNNIPANSVSVPAILDVDEDGDMDVVGWNITSTATLAYYTGQSVENGWSCDSLRFNEVTKCWGHFSFSQGSNSATLGVFCREMDPDLGWDRGTMHNDDTQSCILLYDQDGDLDKDMLTGGLNDNNILYLHNSGSPASANFDYQDLYWPAYGPVDSLVSFPCVYNLDVDNDGKKDMVAVPHNINDQKGVRWYKNTNLINDTGIYTRQPGAFLQEQMIDVGTVAAPQIFDYDCDGLPDLLIGNSSYHIPTDPNGTNHKGITLYRNTGTLTAPQFKLITRDFADIDVLNGFNGPFASTFGDIDGDGDPDMITGSDEGWLHLFKNTAGPCSPASFMPPTGHYMNIDAGTFSVPQLYDLDHDGVLDLIVGCGAGTIKYYRNTGTLTVPAFSTVPTEDTLGDIVVRHPEFTSGHAAPVFYTDTGVVRLMVGTFGGKVYIYNNITGNELGAYHLADSLINGEEGQHLIPAIGDINNDGRPDAVIGNSCGGVSLFMNGFGVGVKELTRAVLPSFYAYPNPGADEVHFTFYHLQNKTARLQILNSIGQIIYTTPVINDDVSISLKNFANGIYLARLISADNVQSIKLVVRH